MMDWNRRIIGTGILCLALAGTLAGRADVSEDWRKARTVAGVVWGDGACASVQVKCGKASRQGVATVAMTVTPFFGRKTSYRAQKITPPASGSVVVTWPDGAYVELSDGGIVDGGLPGDLRVEAVTPGAALASGAAFDLDAEGLADALPGLFGAYLPSEIPVGTDGRGRWTVANGAKPGKVVYLRGTRTVDESKLGANPAGLKLTYTPKTGLFKGTFKAWQDVKGKVKGVPAKVAGILIDGDGHGQAQIGKLAPVSAWIYGGVVPTPQELRGVQLWANGPYWAECNVGASKPEEYGYYFWWGDTVGYTWSGGTWNGSSYDGVTWVSSSGTRMGSSPFLGSRCPTFAKTRSQLQSAGYIDATGNLVARYDAATAHLGAPWRMPTDAEFAALINNCTTTWTTRNGVYGRLVTGKGAFSTKSIFFPAAGYGNGSYLTTPGSNGRYWSSTPDSDYSGYAWFLYFDSGNFSRYSGGRNYGRPVRPVRGFAK